MSYEQVYPTTSHQHFWYRRFCSMVVSKGTAMLRPASVGLKAMLTSLTQSFSVPVKTLLSLTTWPSA